MIETLDYIESYFENSLTAQERTQFEQRITTDAAFANEVAFYVQARQALRQDLLLEKEKGWKETPVIAETTPARVIPITKPPFLKRWMAAAAGVVVAAGTYLIFLLNGAGSAMQIAKDYEDSAFAILSINMAGDQDSLQQGLSAYNQGNYNEAEKLLTAVHTAHPENYYALKFNGIVSLKKKDYDKAFSQFQMLAADTEIRANPGLFYQAITLLLRNGKGDIEAAKERLKMVVNKDLVGKPKAVELLDKLK